MALTQKQKAFVREYLIDLNATQAAIRSGYSKKTARQIGEQNLSKIYIQKEIQKAIEKREARTEITQDIVVKEIAEIALIRPHELDLWPGGKLSDKTKNLELLGKHLGIFDENKKKSEDTESDNLQEMIDRAIERKNDV